MPPNSDNCPNHPAFEAWLGRVETKIDDLLNHASVADMKIAVLEVRLSTVEGRVADLTRVISGVAALVGVAVLGAVLRLVVLNG